MHAPRPPCEPKRRLRCSHAAEATADHRLIQAPADETVLAMADLYGWRFEPAEVTYERRTVLFGGAIGWLITGAISAIGNYQARQEAERLAAPQWRPLGPLVVQATQQRLLVWHNEAWSSVWYSGVTSWHCDDGQLILWFKADPPYLLCGDVRDIVDVVATFLRCRAAL